MIGVGFHLLMNKTKYVTAIINYFTIFNYFTLCKGCDYKASSGGNYLLVMHEHSQVGIMGGFSVHSSLLICE